MTWFAGVLLVLLAGVAALAAPAPGSVISGPRVTV